MILPLTEQELYFITVLSAQYALILCCTWKQQLLALLLNHLKVYTYFNKSLPWEHLGPCPRFLYKRPKKRLPVHTPFLPFPFFFCVKAHRAHAAAWLRTLQGSAEGGECVYYNTFTPYTMFSLWSWLSPVGPLRSQPLLSLILWGLINQSR